MRGKNELMWLHTYGKRRSYMRREEHSDFEKGRKIEERKVDSLEQIEFERLIRIWGNEQELKKKGGGGTVHIKGSSGRKGDRQKEDSKDFWKWRIEETEKEQLQPRLSKYAFHYFWNFYPCLIFQCACFWIFIVLLIFGVDAKGPQFDLLRLICLHICAVLIFLFLCLWFYLKTIWI